MKILTIDLGTNTGWCIGEAGKIPTYGTLVLANAREIREAGKRRENRKEDMRIRRFWKWVRDIVAREQPDLVVWEDVEFSTFTYQTQLWSALRTVLQLGARSAHNDAKPLVFDCVPVTSLKKFAGNSFARKEHMRAYLLKKHPELEISSVDDNAIDAIWIFKWAECCLARILKPDERTESKTTDQPVDLPECGKHDDQPD